MPATLIQASRCLSRIDSVRKGGKKALVPLAPGTAQAIDLTIVERCQGPIFLTASGQRLDRHGAGRINAGFVAYRDALGLPKALTTIPRGTPTSATSPRTGWTAGSSSSR